MDWVRVARVAGAILAASGLAMVALGGDMLGVSIVTGGSGSLALAGLVVAGVGWVLRMWARSRIRSHADNGRASVVTRGGS